VGIGIFIVVSNKNGRSSKSSVTTHSSETDPAKNLVNIERQVGVLDDTTASTTASAKIPESSAPISTPTPSPTPDELNSLTPEQKLRADQLTSLFENGKTDIQYDYIENLDDGRGYTAGKAGFTTADGDLYVVVKLYLTRFTESRLAKYLPTLKDLAEKGSSKVSKLKGFADDWKKTADENVAFRDAQDEVTDKLYYFPALKLAQDNGVVSALGRAFFYDTIIQHGEGDDPDSIGALIDKTSKNMHGSPKDGVDESKWLTEMINVRKADLKNPDDSSTQDVWKQSTGRCDVFMAILKDGNMDLTGPIKIKTKEYDVTIN